MIGFKPVKNRGKVEFYTHVESTMPSHFVLRLKVIFWTSCTQRPFWTFTPSCHSSDHCSHFTNLVLLASCPWGAVIWYWSVWQVFINLSGYFPSCSFFASLTCKLHKRRQEKHWCFLTLTSLSIAAWCTWVVDHYPPLHCLHSPE